ncbi:NlpC/P60 family protein [Tabrizicola oligotrophica]|uniref:Peptidase n=1 Tax=Tabrizicola oligotrophica TaxID=2710650 RepID=A0A6M0QPD5_9RHOB|nr:NlpC/P60 family protein [Tabrizicola oligotrophica]NEY89289.1 peptidase [Tabrizicola oligotrophica]
MSRGAEVLARAEGWLGTPYRHQASCKGAGTDCLGLLRGVWREVHGAEPTGIPAYTADWSEPQGREELLDAARQFLIPVAAGQEQPGDVLLFRMRPGAVAKHLGILARTGEAAAFIHAYCGHGVVLSPLSAPWRRKIAAIFRFP